MPVDPNLQEKAQKLREQAQQTSWLDGYDIVNVIDGILHLFDGPAPDFNEIGEQLSNLAESLKDAVPDIPDVDAGELLQPLLEGIGDLIGSLGDFSS